jgi:hypothetical protein
VDWADDLLIVARMAIRPLAKPTRRLLSPVRIADDSVIVRNFPAWRRSFSCDEVSRFDWQQTDDNETVAVLLLTNGEAVTVHALSDNRPSAISTLNNHLRHARHLRIAVNSTTPKTLLADALPWHRTSEVAAARPGTAFSALVGLVATTTLTVDHT